MEQKKWRPLDQCEKRDCNSCGGTGLYTASPLIHDGAAVVCRDCKGRGYRHCSKGTLQHSYHTPFIYRKKKEGITRVFEAESYKIFYPCDHTFENGTTVKYSEFGCSIEEWENGMKPKPWPKK